MVVDETQVVGGELCYMLNEGDEEDAPVWYQTLGQDGHPVLKPSHAEVLLSDDGNYFNKDDDGLASPLWTEGYETYSITGVPVTKSQKGIHIIHNRNGKSFKVLVK